MGTSAANRPLTVAVADLGSATVHLLVVAVGPHGTLRSLHEESARLMLGGRATAAGAISPDAEGETLATLVRYADVVDRFGAAPFLIVATEAVRSATNGAALARRLGHALGRPITVLTAKQELELATLGAYEGNLPAAGLFADSGGGSTQVAAIRDGAIVWQHSMPLGASALTTRYLHHDPPTPDEIAAAVGAIEQALATLPPPPEHGAWHPGITGGSATTIGAFGIGGCAPDYLSPRCVTAAVGLARGQPSAALAASFSLAEARARILCAGCLILQHLLAWSGIGLWQICGSGLREGVVRAWLANPERWATVPGRQDGAGDGAPRRGHEA